MRVEMASWNVKPASVAAALFSVARMWLVPGVTSAWLIKTPSDFTARRLVVSAVVRMPRSARF